MEKEILVITNIDNKVELKKINNHFKTLQEIVGGTISMPYISEKLSEQEIDICINDEGKLIGLNPTYVIDRDDSILDIIVGNCIFMAHDSEGESISLNEKQVNFLEKMFCQRAFIKYDEEVCEVGIIKF